VVHLTRREILVALSAAAAQACATAIPEPVCVGASPARCGAQDPLPFGDPKARCEIYAFDEVHRATPIVLVPTCEQDLLELFRQIPAGRHASVRGGGQALFIQSLNDDILISLQHKAFQGIGAPQEDEHGYFLTTGGGAIWEDVIKTVAPLGLMPPSVVTAQKSTVGGTLASDCLSRTAAVVGKEGNQIRSFRLVTPAGKVYVCARDSESEPEKSLFNAAIGGFGNLGVVTEVTFDLIPVRSRPMTAWKNPCVQTRSTRHGPSVDWDALLRQLEAHSVKHRSAFHAHHRRWLNPSAPVVPDTLASAPEWTALSIAAFLTGKGMGANLLEQRYVEPQALRPFPSGIYDVANAFPPAAEQTSAVLPTLVELGLDLFPEGIFVDELLGWTFFLGNSTAIAKANAHSSGYRLNFTQQSFALPAGMPGASDTRPMRRFLERVEARLHAADLHPEAIDFLYVPADDFLMSASRGLASYVVTISFAEKNRKAFSRSLVDTYRALSSDCRELGGRVHLVKGVYVDPEDLRAMYGDAAKIFRVLKATHDPKDILRNEFFDRVFNA
jgi:FAD/FMN-containing dehydrogenase